MFQLNEIESEKVSWSQNVTLNKSGNSRGFNIKYLPKAFTEQGVYMLMTVLKGELAIKQSLALIRLFKQMKDYIVDNRVLLDANSLLKIPKRLDKHDRDIRSIKHDLKEVMSNFIDPNTYKHFLIMNGEKVEAEEAYEKIYSLAKQSIIVIDDYISERTLRLMKHVNRSVSITIFSDNVSKDFIIDEDLTVFEKEYGIKATLFPTNNKFHDRYIMIDYKTDNEKLFDCGSSSKDTGNKVTTIMLVEKSELYHSLIDELLEQK